jgi:acyl-CoA synthetase (AMP-forming)/AMP-acid ligase II
MGTGYGLTETSGMVTLTVGEEFLENRHTAGKPVPTVEMRLVDESGREVAAGEPGEVCVRGASLFLGYCDGTGVDPSLDADGWFRTGDVGILDAGGFLSIVDRRKDMVISAGENIYCAEVERALSMHPDVVEVAALGVPDERLGERLVAVVVPRPGSALATGDLAGMLGPHVAAQLADYKVPREFRAVAETLPRNIMGKVMKAQLRKLLFGGAG